MTDPTNKLATVVRRHQALQMRIAGVSTKLIADRLGYTSEQQVRNDLTSAGPQG